MEFYGLVGEKLSHSLSPKIHNSIFKMLDIEGAYGLFEVEKSKIDSLLDSIKLLNIKGVNVTIPYKETLIDGIDYLSDEGEAIGAINTIFNKDGKLYGYNTDYYGFKYMLDYKNISVLNKKIVVLGTGGASKAVIAYLLKNRAKEIILVSRNKRDLYKEEKKIKVINYKELENIKGDIIINTTPLGMYPNINESPVSKDVIKNFSVILDLIYNPLETKFLSFGRELNKTSVNGLMMLVGQAIKAEEIWQERSIDKKVIIDIYNDLKKNFK